MPRLRNVQSGAVVSVSDETAVGLATSEWKPADEAETKTPAKKSAPSKTEK